MRQHDPSAVLRVLGPWIRQVHIKDARRTRVPGTWGEEAAASTGEVNWQAFFATLRKLECKGNFVVEREAGTQRVVDVRAAREMVAGMGSYCGDSGIDDTEQPLTPALSPSEGERE